MFGIAAKSGRYERRTPRRLSTWTREYLREVALADLGCAVVGVFAAAQIRFGRNVTPSYLALSLALPLLCIAALLLARAHADHVCRRLVVKPGLTGLWQVSGRTCPGRVGPARPAIRVELIGRAGPADLMETVSVLLRGSGAY
jgi:hypothetical protein